MPEITLNHTILYCRDNLAAAQFYVRVFGFEFVKEWGHFAVVKVNSGLTLDFMARQHFTPQHYAFKVSDTEFDTIIAHLQAESVPYGSSPSDLNSGVHNNLYGGRGAYFADPDGHVLEIITHDYELD